VYTFAKLGVADKMVDASDKGLTAGEIAVKNDWNADLLYRLLRSCADAGIVKRASADNERFCLTSTGKLLLTDDPSQIIYYVRLLQGPVFEEPGTALPDLISKKTTLDSIQKKVTGGLDFYDWIGQDKQKSILREENGCMAAVTDFVSRPLAIGFDFSGFESIVDCGGNQGGFLAHLLEHYPMIKRGIVFDLPPAIKLLTDKQFEIRHIEPNRFEFVSGDLFDAKTIPPNADAYILRNILDAYNDDKVIAIFSAIYDAVRSNRHDQKSNVTILVIGMHSLPEENSSLKAVNWQCHALDIMESVLTGGCERTVKQFQLLFQSAGLEYMNYYSTGTPESIIEARIQTSRQ